MFTIQSISDALYIVYTIFPTQMHIIYNNYNIAINTQDQSSLSN